MAQRDGPAGWVHLGRVKVKGARYGKCLCGKRFVAFDKVEILRAGGDPECLVDIPQWDFWWQIAYGLEQEVEVSPLDSLRLECHFDNSPENQPIIDGKQMTPRDMNWGDGSLDEMCLVGLYVTRAK